jgi:hypothetical protein
VDPFPERLIYVETTSLVSDEFVASVQPVVTIKTMAYLTQMLAATNRADLTHDEQRQLDHRISKALDPRAPAAAASVTKTMRGRAEAVTRLLGLTLVAAGSRVTEDDPICSPARGWALDPTWFMSYAQGFALATWESVTYPENGDWSGGPDMSAWLSFYDTDVPPGEADRVSLTLDNPQAPYALLLLWQGQQGVDQDDLIDILKEECGQL